MNLAPIVAVFCGVLLHGSDALRCYNCSSTVETTGCGDGSNMYDSFLVDCDPEAIYCSLLVVNGSTSQSDVLSYNRQCIKHDLTLCSPTPPQDEPDFVGMSCFTSCQTDKCNGKQVKPTPPVQEATKGSTDGTATDAPSTTTSDAQHICNRFYVILNLLVCFLCTVFFSGFQN